MSHPAPPAGISQDGGRRNAFGRSVLVPADTPEGSRTRCTVCRALVCPDCGGCHCAANACTHVPHRCCGGGSPE